MKTASSVAPKDHRLRVLRRALVSVGRTSPLAVGALCCLTLIQALTPAARLWITKAILDAVVQGVSVEASAARVLVPLVGLYLVVLLTSAGVAQAVLILRELLGEVIGHGATHALLSHAASLDLSHFESPQFYDRLRRAEQDAAQRPVLVLSQLLQVGQSVVTLLSMVIVLLRLHWTVLLLIAVFGTPQLFLQVRFAKKGHQLRTDQTQDIREMQYLSYLLTSAETFKEVRVFQIAKWLLGTHDGVWRRLYAARRAHALSRLVAMVTSSAASTTAYICFYGVAVYLAFNHRMTVGDLVLYSGAYLQTQTDVAAIIGSISGLYENALFIGTFYEFFGYHPTIRSPATLAPLPRPMARSLEFRHVWFRYPGRSEWALRDVSFRIGVGESVALVGRNGAGKSTIVKLVCRLYDPERGEVLLDGQDIRSLPLDEYQRIISVVFQDFVRFYFSAGMNIGVGLLDHAEEQTRIRRAAIDSGADPFIRRLEGGYDAILGRLFRDGQELSGGQWQKLAIARAFMRDGAIVILDEPVASLDPVAEAELLGHMRRLANNRISLLISHRLTHTTSADRVLVLSGGSIIEEGSHDDLLELGGQYSALFRTQLAQYGRDVLGARPA
jgi:ATP-binding cassette subfamily B protein